MQKNIYPLDYYGFIRLQGVDAKKFLQGQVTCNIDEVTATQSRLGARTTPQGRVISIFRAFMYQDCLMLRLPLSLVQTTIDSLKKYAIFSKVTLENMSEQFSAYGIQTENSFLNDDLPANADATIPTQQGILAKVPGTDRYEYYFEKDATQEALKHLADYSIQNGEAWRVLEIKENLAQIYPETSEHFTPHDLKLPEVNAVSFNKGCYSGQEIVARMHYRATLKQHLYQAQLNADFLPSRGTAILHTDTVGYLIDYARESSGNLAVLALIRDEAINQALSVNNTLLIVQI